MSWLRRASRKPEHTGAARPLIEPDPLRTPDDAFETGFLIGALKNTWEAIAVKNLKDRRIATSEADSQPAIGPAGHVAGHRAGEKD